MRMTTFCTYQADGVGAGTAPASTTTFAFYAEGVGLTQRGRACPPSRRRPVLLDGAAGLLQCNACGTFLKAGDFYRLANVKSVCGRVSECKPCAGRRRKLSKRGAGRAAAVAV